MNTAQRQMMMNNPAWWQRVRSTNPTDFWPMWEASGTTVQDIVNSAGNGTSSGATPGAAGLGGRYALSFDGTSDYVNIGNARVIANWNPSEFSIHVLAKVSAAADWTDGSFRRLWHWYMDAQNTVRVFRATDNILSLTHIGNNVNKPASLVISTTGWFHVAMKVSAVSDYLRTVFNGEQILMTDVTGLGAWQGTLTAAALGSDAATLGANCWKGLEGYAIYFDRVTSTEEDRIIASILSPKRYLLLGDSIPAANNNGYSRAITTYPGNIISSVINHSVGGSGINGLSTQIAAAANDDVSEAWIHTGTNDYNAGDMVALQATFESALSTLKSQHPGIEIKVFSVLKRWTNNTTGPEVDKSNIRTAMAAGALAQGVTYVDTYTSPWVAQNQMSADGMHPATAGQVAMQTQILAL